MMGFNNILDFDEYFKSYSIHEKMGVMERNVYKEIDEYGISKIINDFIYNISNHVDEDYEITTPFFDDIISIKYRPNSNKKGIYGETKKGIIFIYRKYEEENHLDFKYTIVHELNHITHQILSENDRPYEELNTIEKLRYILLKTSLENLTEHDDIIFLHHILYIIDINELYAMNQNAYISAFKYKKENSNISNSDISLKILKKFKLSSGHLSISINELKNDKVFENIIYFLIGSFNEMGKNKNQVYFDKSVFELDVINKMRKEIKKIIYNESSINIMVKNTVDIVSKYKIELYDNKNIIINSFIEHFKYWFKNAQKRLGKSIQLGIDDAQ